jgi:CRP-like cAMP-binding protein
VKLTYIASDGSEHLVGLRSSGYIVGLQSVTSHKPVPYAGSTTGPALIRTMPRALFLRALDSAPALARHVNEALSVEAAAGWEQVISLRTESAQERVMRLLREVPDARDLTEMSRNLGLRHKDVAHLLSITPEHLARLLVTLRPNTGEPTPAAKATPRSKVIAFTRS